MSPSVGPFLSYYGSKWRASGLYDPPTRKTIIEPFAGAAGYSCLYHKRDVILIDANEKVAGAWDFLIRSSVQEILALKAPVEHVDEVVGPQEARWIVGFWLNNGAASPCKSPGKWNRIASELGHAEAWGPRCRQRLASGAERIRHWKIIHGDYRSAPGIDATWFIDPPYCGPAGSHYPHGSGMIDYKALAEWCVGRKGQVQVCEAEGASWLPFVSIGDIKAAAGKRRKGKSGEAVWSNEKTQHSLWDAVDVVAP